MSDSIEAKLDHIIRQLDRLCADLNPVPGYVQGSDGLWRNRITGESQYDEQLKRAAVFAAAAKAEGKS
jgi:hypothetical protein